MKPSIAATTCSVFSIGVPAGSSMSPSTTGAFCGGKKVAGTKRISCITPKKISTTAKPESRRCRSMARIARR